MHGKNPHEEGTFRHCVADLTLVHPRHGRLRISSDSEPALFELTLGGYGLTGIISSASLRLEPLEAQAVHLQRRPLESLSDGLTAVRSLTGSNDFAYTWHDGATSRGRFGSGFVYTGRPADPVVGTRTDHRYPALTASTRAVLPFCGFQRWTTPLITAAFRRWEALKPESRTVSLFEALFPFARRREYFLLYGRPGLAEVPATHTK